MTLTEDTITAGVDPLAMDDVDDDQQQQDGNIERVEHAPNENKKDEDNGDDDGRIYLWLSLLVAIVGAVVIVVVVLVAGGSDDDGEDMEYSPAKTETFPPIATVDSMQTQLDMIRAALGENEVTKNLLDVVPPTSGELDIKFLLDADAHPALQAAAWVVLEDGYNAENQIVERFALMTIYLETQGRNWIEKEGWMTSTSVCDNWHGIQCCQDFAPGTNPLCAGKHPEHLSFLDLTQNNLTGPFSVAFALLKDLHVLMLGWNNLSGPLNGDIVAAMPYLQTLFVQHNTLSGPFDPSLVGNGALNTFYAQGNYFTGDWPADYCVLFAYHFDCFRNKCIGDCCATTDILDECTNLGHYYGDEPSDEGL